MQASFEHDFLFLLYDVARMMRTRADQRARTRGMTRAQWVILARLERQPGMSQNEMAAVVEVEPITIARLVDRLEARGLVERTVAPGPPVRVTYALTELGRGFGDVHRALGRWGEKLAAASRAKPRARAVRRRLEGARPGVAR